MSFLKELLVYLIVIAIVSVTGIFPNMYFNNQDIISDGYESHSYPTLPDGHVEYTLYSDGAQDVKIYSWFGHGLFDSRFYQDLDGDNKVDRIRVNAQEWKWNKLEDLLVREYDYESNRKEFDKADAKLQELIEKYQ